MCKKNNFLFKHRNALKFLRTSVTDASLKNELDVKSDVYRIESSVELYGIKADVRLSNARAFNSYSSGVIDYLLAEIRQENSDVFEAIAVSARVKYSVGLYTNSFLADAGAA